MTFFRYTPSNTSFTGVWRDSIKGKSINWWRKDRILEHDGLLISYAYGKGYDVRRQFDIQDNVYLVGDSGGFQQLREGIRFNPMDVLRWQEANCNIGFSLDVPPLDPVSLRPLNDWNFFKKCADESDRNLDIMSRNRMNKEMLFYGVLQGSTLKQLEYWHRNFDKYDLDGICLTPKPPGDPMQTALQAGYAHMMGHEKIHIFLSTGKSCMPMNVYASRNIPQITFDSSGYMTGGGAKRLWWVPYQIDVKIPLLSAEDYKLSIDELPCDCPVCQIVPISDYLKKHHRYTTAIGVHNLWVYLKQIDTFYKLRNERELYFELLKKSDYQDVITAILFYEDIIENGIYEAYHKWMDKHTNVVKIF